MNYDLQKKEGGTYLAEVKLTAKEWEEYVEHAYEKNKNKFSVQGFRKGHAPRSVIEKQYGAQVFLQDAIDDLYYKAYGEIVTEHKEVKPIDAPKLDIKKFDADGLVITLEIACMPEFELGQYKDMTFKKAHVDVTEEVLNEQINRDLMRASRLVATNKPVANDDTVTLDFEGFIDDVAFDGGKAENYQLKIGSHSFIDNFEDQLIGLNIGDNKEVKVNFPADYHEEKYAGKPAIFKVSIKDIRNRILPELNDEFVANNTEYKTVEEYKTNLKNELQKREDDKAEMEISNQIIDKIVENTKLEIPTTLIDKELDYIMHNFEHQLSHQGLKLEDYAQYLGKTIEEMKEEQRVNAEKQVKTRLVLQALLEKENLDVKEGQFDAKLETFAKYQNVNVEEFKKNLTEEHENQILNAILNDNIIEFLKNNNKID